MPALKHVDTRWDKFVVGKKLQVFMSCIICTSIIATYLSFFNVWTEVSSLVYYKVFKYKTILCVFMHRYKIKVKQWWAVELNNNALGKNNRTLNFTGPPIFLIIKVLTLILCMEAYTILIWICIDVQAWQFHEWCNEAKNVNTHTLILIEIWIS